MNRIPFLSETLANFALSTTFEAIPEKVRGWVKLLLLDAVGNAFASTSHDFAHRALAGLQGLDAGDYGVIGMPARLTLRDAVLMNGILVHGLDFDDTYLPGAAHLTASVVPTVLALAARFNSSGKELLAACVIGLEGGMRLAGAARGSFLKAGFHPTSLCGAFGSVLAASRLMQLSHAHTVMAQGIVLSSVSGNMQPTQEGVWAKRMHAGLMGSAALTAAALAQQGFTGPFQVYEGKYGLFPCFLGQHADDADLSVITHQLGSSWECARTSIKLFPACFQSHASMQAALELRTEEAIDSNEIVSIRVRIPDIAVSLVCEPIAAKLKPNNSYAAQFSLPYALACCFARGRFGLDEIEGTAFGDPELLELAQKVSYEVDPSADFPKFRSGEVIVELKNGKRLMRRKKVSPEEPATEDAIIRKFMDNTRSVIAPARAWEIAASLTSLETIKFTQTLVAALT